jgi:hypothetical protein
MKLFNALYLLAIGTFLMSSCASVTGFEEGRTLGEENSEFGASINFISSPDLLTEDGDFEVFNLPNIEVVYKYGAMEKLDIGGRVSSNFNIGTFAKYQVVGDRTSQFALSPGFEIATFLGLGYAFHIPLYASIHPTQNVSININPRYVWILINDNNIENDGANYLGGNVGLLIGKRHKFGIDIGLYNIGGIQSNSKLFTIGIGGRFRFGNNMTPMSSSGGDDGRERNDRRKKRRR